MTSSERRQHPRLAIRLPVAHRPAGEMEALSHQAFTTDIGPGGVRFLTKGQANEIGDKVAVELTVPPGEGYFPYSGKILGVGTVVRCQAIESTEHPRWAIAASFDQPLALDFQ